MISRAKKYVAVLLAFVCVCMIFSPQTAYAAEDSSQHEIVKVGFFAMDGYHVMDEEGNRSGYGYDFLRLMARYWDVDYEYVGYDKSWDDMQQMLEDGEIDMVTSPRKTQEGGWKRIDGPYFKQWIEWRASVIYDFFKRTKEELKAVKPGLKFGAYTGAWYPSYFEVGVNWASNTYDPSQDFAWATPEYKNYGYAELLDIFTNGNYYWNVTVDEYRRSNGLHKNETDSEMSKGDHLSVEGGCRYSRRLLGGRPFFGGMYVEDYKRDTTQFKRAVEMNLRESDGLMVFDIVHIINRDWWGPLQRAVSAYEAEAKQ